jgi:DNA-directed RNA polymerase specialized sigma24 family protein
VDAEGREREPVGSAVTADPGQRLSEHEEHEALVRRLDAALAGLNSESRALYELRFRQQLSVAELAAHFAKITH